MNCPTQVAAPLMSALVLALSASLNAQAQTAAPSLPLASSPVASVVTPEAQAADQRAIQPAAQTATDQAVLPVAGQGPAAVPSYPKDRHTAEPPIATGKATRGWLNAQDSGKDASLTRQTLSGPVMTQVHKRYVESFAKPVPDNLGNLNR